MSYDSVQMLEEARSSVRGGIFPAAPVYILRLFDITGNGPTLMILAQDFITLLGITIILRLLGAGVIVSAISLLAILAVPTVIGCMLVLWKDVTLVSLIVISIATIFWASQTNKEDIFYGAAKWSSLLWLMMGTLTKFNAITSTAIVAFYWLTVFYNNKGWKKKGGLFIAIVICMAASNKIVNSYSFPELKKLEPNNYLYGLMAYDLVGISGWSRVSLIPFDSVESGSSPKAPISDIDDIYSSMGLSQIDQNNKTFGNRVNIFPSKYRNEDITNAWLAAVTAHPMAYMRYRWDLFSEIIGARNHATYEPTHFNHIDENPFGIKFHDRDITKITLKYIEVSSNIFFGKPWFVFLLSFISLILIYMNRLIKPAYKMLAYYSFAAAVLYIVPFFAVTLTGEVRYSFPAIVLCSITILVWIFAQDRRSDIKHRPL